MKAYRGIIGKVPLILNLGRRWRSVVNSMPRPLCSRDGTAVGPRAGLDVSEKRKTFCTYRNYKPPKLNN
jgi:hypothetical protein